MDTYLYYYKHFRDVKKVLVKYMIEKRLNMCVKSLHTIKISYFLASITVFPFM